jgi:hypothetical protein
VSHTRLFLKSHATHSSFISVSPPPADDATFTCGGDTYNENKMRFRNVSFKLFVQKKKTYIAREELDEDRDRGGE